VNTWGSDPNQCATCVTLGCSGGRRCEIGYLGDRCFECEDGFFSSRIGDRTSCLPCTDATLVAFFLVTGLLLVIIVIAVKLNSTAFFQRLTNPFRIALTYIQGTSTLSLRPWSVDCAHKLTQVCSRSSHYLGACCSVVLYIVGGPALASVAAPGHANLVHVLPLPF